ncbi:MAG: D-alanyl-D-alanine carboxypeptidase [Bacteriovoracaceae bacterium]
MKTSLLLFSLLITPVFAQNVPDSYTEKLTKYNLVKNDQAFCLGDDSVSTFDHNAKKIMKPASLSKLYVTDWALKTVGGHYRYETKFALKDGILYIKGGDDPFFATESVMAVMEYLNKMGVKELEQIIFDAHFTLNWSDDSAIISKWLSDYFNKGSSVTRSEMNHVRLRTLQLGLDFFRKGEESKVKSVKFQANIDENIFTQAKVFSLKSSPLYKHLKQMNIYSNNFYAQKLFDHLGGIGPFHEYMKNEFSADQSEIKFFTGSGLGENYTTCDLTLRLLSHLEKEIANEKLELKEVVSVAGSDLGTLRNRFSKAPYNKSVIAKTGTLNMITTLAGYLYTEKGLKYFAVLNRTADLDKGRSFENDLIQGILKDNFRAEPIDYELIHYSPLDDIILE